MKILLLGANGQLGRSLMEEGSLAQRGTLVSASRDGQRFDGAEIETVNLAAPETLPPLLDRIQPDLIVNAAAYTAVDKAEQESALSMRINAEAVGVLGAWASKHDAWVVHYSTDYVFDGTARIPYPINTTTAPLGAYGRSKLAGEVALRESGAAHYIFRTAWVYAPHGKNFLRTMLAAAAKHKRLRIVADQFGAPTSTALIVSGTLAALDTLQSSAHMQRSLPSGTHHLVASGYTHWHGFASAIFAGALRRGLLARRPQLEAITSNDYPTHAQRPAWSVLDNTDFTTCFGYALPHWRSGLEEVLDVLATSHTSERAVETTSQRPSAETRSGAWTSPPDRM